MPVVGGIHKRRLAGAGVFGSCGGSRLRYRYRIKFREEDTGQFCHRLVAIFGQNGLQSSTVGLLILHLPHRNGTDISIFGTQRLVGADSQRLIRQRNHPLPLFFRICLISSFVLPFHLLILLRKFFVIVGLTNQTGVVSIGILGEDDLLRGFLLAAAHFLISIILYEQHRRCERVIGETAIELVKHVHPARYVIKQIEIDDGSLIHRFGNHLIGRVNSTRRKRQILCVIEFLLGVGLPFRNRIAVIIIFRVILVLGIRVVKVGHILERHLLLVTDTPVVLQLTGTPPAQEFSLACLHQRGVVKIPFVAPACIVQLVVVLVAKGALEGEFLVSLLLFLAGLFGLVSGNLALHPAVTLLLAHLGNTLQTILDNNDLQIVNQIRQNYRFPLDVIIIRIAFGHRSSGRIVIGLGLRVLFLKEVEIGELDGGMRALETVFLVSGHRLGKVHNPLGRILINAVHFRHRVINLIPIGFVLLLLEHLVQLLHNLGTPSRRTVIVGGEVHPCVELQFV